MEKSLMKIQSDASCYYLMTQYNDQEDVNLEMILVDGVNVWTGTMSNESLRSQAESAEKNFQDFLSETKKAFSFGKSKTTGGLCHNVEIDGDYAVLSWKQVLDHGIKFQLGTAKLCKDQNNNINTFFDVVVSQFMKMKEDILDLSSTKEKLLSEREKTLKRLDEFVLAKDEIEKDLYQKFTLVLNEKKAKIRDLKQKCEELKRHPYRSEHEDVSATKKHDESDTDETDNEGDQVIKRSKVEKELPALLNEDVDEDETAPAARRRAGNRRQKNNTAAKVPRTISLPRAMKKEKSNADQIGSRNSSMNQSSDDFDKLMDLMN